MHLLYHRSHFSDPFLVSCPSRDHSSALLVQVGYHCSLQTQFGKLKDTLFSHSAHLSRVSAAVSNFLCEAATMVSRRPHELYENILNSKKISGHAQGTTYSGVSLLAIAACKQAVKVLNSQKMALACKAAIAGYVSGKIESCPKVSYSSVDTHVHHIFSACSMLECWSWSWSS